MKTLGNKKKSKIARTDFRKRFLVISYDHDEMQLFYDIVFAIDSQTAINIILDLREYAINLDVLSLSDVAKLHKRVANITVNEAQNVLEALQLEKEWT